MSLALCLSCAHLFELDEEDDELCCPECGVRVSRDRYDRLRLYAERLIRFGCQYRALYEEQIESDAGESRSYVLPLNEIYTFVALAIVSGVVGNGAYAAVEAVIRRVRAQAADHALAPKIELDLLAAEITKLRQYVAEMAIDPGAIKREVLAAVLDEVLVDFAMEIRNERSTGGVSSSGALSGEGAREEARRRLPEYLSPPGPVDWDDLWKNAGA